MWPKAHHHQAMNECTSHVQFARRCVYGLPSRIKRLLIYAYQQSCEKPLVHNTAKVWNCRFRLLRTHITFMQLQMHLVLTKSSRSTSQLVSSKTSEIAGSITFGDTQAIYIGIVSWSDLMQHSWEVIIMVVHLCRVKMLTRTLDAWKLGKDLLVSPWFDQSVFKFSLDTPSQ